MLRQPEKDLFLTLKISIYQSLADTRFPCDIINRRFSADILGTLIPPHTLILKLFLFSRAAVKIHPKSLEATDFGAPGSLPQTIPQVYGVQPLHRVTFIAINQYNNCN